MPRMSTTVIASRRQTSLYLLPAGGAPLDQDAVAAVLARHGLGMAGGSDLADAHEFIAAEGLDPAAAAELAEDLRGIGLHARVVNGTGITASRRLGSALGAQFMAFMAGLAGVALSAKPLADLLQAGQGPGLWILPLAAAALLMLMTVVNAILLNRNTGLRVVGTSASPRRALQDELRLLEEHLPAHMAAPLLERARALEQVARRDPDGAAAIELRALIDDLRRPVDEAAAEDARKLRQDVARARRAMQETGGR
ncbi:MAG: hypothetical protein H6742_19625 [Alphaproteobacteria bacterium]|nr:hypothetical protein [Alphaproteobacteria bacterium]